MCDITKWNGLEMGSMPFAQIKYDANNLAASHSAHAALILFFLSDEMQRAHGDAAQAINAGYQTRFERPVTYADLRNFLSLGHLRGDQVVRDNHRFSGGPAL